MITNHLNRRSLMNTKLFKLITAGTLAVLLSSCGDTVVDNEDNSPVQSKATINVRVRDVSGGAEAPLAAKVTLNTTKEVQTSDVAGNVSFKNIPIGGHSVLVERADYATAVFNATIATSVSQNIAIAQDVTVSADIYPKTATLQGVVVEENDNGTLIALDSATVRVELNNTSIVTRIFTTVTNPDGSFAFDSLPAVGENYSLVISDKAKKYKTISGPSRELKAGLPAYAGTIRYNSSQLNSFFELVSHPSVIKSTDNITLKFSSNIDFSRFTTTVVSIVPIDGSITNGSWKRIVPAGAASATAPADSLVIGLVGATVDAIPQWPAKFQICFNDLKAENGKGTGIGACTRDIYASDIAVPFRLETYNDHIDSTESVVLTFSQDIDAAAFKPDWIKVNTLTTYSKVTIAGNKITVSPAGTTWHNVGSSFTILISGDLKAANGTTLGSNVSKTITLKVRSLTADKVSAPLLDSTSWGGDTLDYDAGGARLKWAKVPGAESYDIYGKASIGSKPNDYVYLTSVTNKDNFYNPDSMLQQWVSFDAARLGLSYSDHTVKALQDNNTLKLIIQARNSASETSLSNADSLVIKDLRAPKTPGFYTDANNNIVSYKTSNDYTYNYNWGINLTDWLGKHLAAVAKTTAAETFTTCVTFSEPMDVTVVPTGQFLPNQGAAETVTARVTAKLKVEPAWGTKNLLDAVGISNSNFTKSDYDKYLCLTLSTFENAQLGSTGTGAASETLNIRYGITSPLKDKAGNVYNLPSGVSGIPAATTVQVNFTATIP